ncbi:hypothetical protein [Sporomusa aerivorans]|uniref:hypothetical protein n=1 Tax=Sporomusa aerivorans TaxID=204936 RepID=UPI003529F4F3
MAYFNKEDVRDELLKRQLKPEDIDESTAYIDDIAARLRVDPAMIPNPAPYAVRTLAMSYALMQAALNASMNNGNGGENAADAYELKRRVYAARVTELEGEINAQTLLGRGSQKSKFPLSISMQRC